MSTLGVVAEILREAAPRALKARQIVDRAGGRLPTASKTPETVVSLDLAIEVRDHGAISRFLRVGRGEFVLKEALPLALYNINDAEAVDWTRGRIAGGDIVEGEVEERHIRDFKPVDVASYRQFHAFSGVGGWSRALRDAGWPDDVNVWTCGCPCLPSALEERKRRDLPNEQLLWPDLFRLVSACRPACIFGERTSLDLVRFDLEGVGYEFRTLGPPVASTHYFLAWAGERYSEIAAALRLRRRPLQGSEDLCQVFSLFACVMAGLDALDLGCPEETSLSLCAEFLTCAGVSTP